VKQPLPNIYKPSPYLAVTYFPTYLPIYRSYFSESLTKWVTKVKPDINSVQAQPQPSHKGHPGDGGLVGLNTPLHTFVSHK